MNWLPAALLRTSFCLGSMGFFFQFQCTQPCCVSYDSAINECSVLPPALITYIVPGPRDS